MAELLGQLVSMGFTDKGTNIKLLKKYDRDLGKVVHDLVEKIAQETTSVGNTTTDVANSEKI